MLVNDNKRYFIIFDTFLYTNLILNKNLIAIIVVIIINNIIWDMIYIVYYVVV